MSRSRIDYVLHRGLTVRDARTLVTGTPRPWLDESGNDWPLGPRGGRHDLRAAPESGAPEVALGYGRSPLRSRW
ncbi:hypothetical protein [Streptomyces sp. NPDC048720]|uniref:hypothetical protein n=1 Tax=Streptomyces sp. NPDC048720 TaxID=3365588 RepID=UPI00371BD147